MIKGRSYPGFCLYFWMLRSLLDLCCLSGTVVVSVVEDVSAATEMTRLVLPSLFGGQQVCAGGGKINRDAAEAHVWDVLQTAEGLGVVEITYTIRRVAKGGQ